MRHLVLLYTLLYTALVSAQPSPYGNGYILNQSLDTLQVDTFYQSHAGDSFSVNHYLNSHNYHLYIPNSYDGTEAYGLITFVNAGNVGNIWGDWFNVLEQKKLIVIAGNGIGNSISVPTRLGVALAGAHAINKELNIDPNRIYTSGNSGGGRTASVLMYLFPEFFTGMIPNCGSAYLRQVAQDYETHQPNSHYEYIYPFTSTELDYVQSFNPKIALLTAYDDFREGDLMNIYHNGMEPDGFSSKLLEIPGNHCATSEQHFRDGINFLEHPRITWILDSFHLSGPQVGEGFSSNASIHLNDGLVLQDTLNTVRFRNAINWNDPQGAIIRLNFTFNTSSSAQNSAFNFGLFDLQNGQLWDSMPSSTGNSNRSHLLLRILADSLQPKAVVLLNNPALGIQKDTLFQGRFSDWDPQKVQKVKIHAWDNEIRLEFGAHFKGSGLIVNQSKLLDDGRSLQILNNNSWDSLSFGESMVFISAQRQSTGMQEAPRLNSFQAIVADTSQSGILSRREESKTSPFSFEVFPNPSEDKVWIRTVYPAIHDMTLTDLQGRTLKYHQHEGHQSELSISDLPKGIYILKGNPTDAQGQLIIKQ